MFAPSLDTHDLYALPDYFATYLEGDTAAFQFATDRARKVRKSLAAIGLLVGGVLYVTGAHIEAAFVALDKLGLRGSLR